MEKLMGLSTVITPDTQAQANDIYKHMEQAYKENKNEVLFTMQKPLHPMIIQLLNNKGYIVEDVTNKLPNGTVSFVAWVGHKYKISIS